MNTTEPVLNLPDAAVVQVDFSGGINAFVPPYKITNEEYVLLQNARTRGGNIKPQKKAKDITGDLTGNGQGLYVAGKYLLTFFNGFAYTKDFTNINADWQQVPAFRMDPDVSRFYAQLVPESFSNFERTSSVNLQGIKISDVNSASPACLVVQDGMNQPRIIEASGNSRIALNYNGWGKSNREYVPIGTLMTYFDGKLYVVKGRRIYPSVTGRPLDFVIAVDENGNKVGDADTTYHSVDYNEVLCINGVVGPSGNSGIFVGNENSSSIVLPLKDQLIYGEPSFANGSLFSTGPVSQFSVIDSLGDTTMIDFNGVRSFNTTSQLQRASNSDIFSSPISRYLDEITQDDTSCVASYKNYNFYSLKTTLGDAILVYDLERKVFVSLDQPTGVAKVKQFASTKYKGKEYIFFLDINNKIWQGYASDEIETVTFTTKAACSLDSHTFAKANQLHIALDNVKSAGTITAQMIADKKVKQLATRTIEVGQRTVTFDCDDTFSGYLLQAKITLKCDCEILSIALLGDYDPATVDPDQRARILRRSS